MKRYTLWMILLLILTVSGTALAQDSVFPLPAPLYILTSDHVILRVDPQTGEQTIASPEGQRVVDFDIAPDGEWYAYRTEDGAVIISALDTGSGYVVEFLERMPSVGVGKQTIAWNADASALAYIVPDGVRIAELGAGEYGAPIFSTVQGPWVELYWHDYKTIIASDAAGERWAIQGTSDQWKVMHITGVLVRPEPAILSYLTANGVALDNNTLIPRTAGSLAYDWGPPPLPVVDGLVMSADLYFLSRDAQGIAQVWQLPRNGDPVRALTAEGTDVTAYAVESIQRRLAYTVADELVVSGLDGANRQVVGTLDIDDLRPTVAWSHRDRSQLALQDGRGIWIVPADGSQPQRLVISHNLPETQADAVNVRFYVQPRWSYDNTRLLVTVGLWEGSVLGVVNVATGELTELPAMVANDALWTLDGRVLAWASAWGYSTPGLFLLDPNQPDAEPVLLLETGTPVVDVALDVTGEEWHALVATSAEMGPQYVRKVSSPLSEEMVKIPDRLGGVFVREPALSSEFHLAGLRDITYTDTGQAHGYLVIPYKNVQIQTLGPVWNVTWG